MGADSSQHIKIPGDQSWWCAHLRSQLGKAEGRGAHTRIAWATHRTLSQSLGRETCKVHCSLKYATSYELPPPKKNTPLLTLLACTLGTCPRAYPQGEWVNAIWNVEGHLIKLGFLQVPTVQVSPL